MLTFGGPLAIVADVSLWIGGVVLAFALLYLPVLDRFAFAPSVSYGVRNVVEAIYVSGVTALTIGFGDVVADTDVLRLVTVAEGAAGAALISAAITYVLSVYPIVTRQRAGAVGSSDLRFDDPASVRALISDRGLAVAAAMPEALMRNRQELLRFPILHYFHPRSEAESSYALLRGAAMICAVLRWGLGSERTTAAGLYANGIRATLDRTIEEYVSGYVHGLASDPHPAQQGDLRLALVGVKPDAEVTETELRESSAWAPHVETFLHRLAVEHRYTPRPLFAPLRPR